MTYTLVYTKRAIKDIKKLDGVAKKRLKKQMEKLASSPFKYSVKLKDAALGGYRFRVGDYRVVFDIKQNNIIVLRAGHRKDI